MHQQAGQRTLRDKGWFKYKGKLGINKQQKMTIPIRKGGPGRASLWKLQRQNQTKQTLSGAAWRDAWNSRGMNLVTQPNFPGTIGFWPGTPHCSKFKQHLLSYPTRAASVTTSALPSSLSSHLPSLSSASPLTVTPHFFWQLHSWDVWMDTSPAVAGGRHGKLSQAPTNPHHLLSTWQAKKICLIGQVCSANLL